MGRASLPADVLVARTRPPLNIPCSGLSYDQRTHRAAWCKLAPVLSEGGRLWCWLHAPSRMAERQHFTGERQRAILAAATAYHDREYAELVALRTLGAAAAAWDDARDTAAEDAAADTLHLATLTWLDWTVPA